MGTSGAFTDQLGVTGSTGTLAFTATGGDVTHLLVSGPGVITTSGALAVGSYTFSGTDSDASGDTGAWSYTLDVGASAITQSAPLTGSTTVGTSGAFTVHLGVTANHGAVAFTATGGDMTHLLVSGPGVITTSATLAAGTYTISGTDSDTSGDTGTWSYTLTIPPQSSTTGGTIKQTSSTSGVTTTGASASFVIGPIVVDGAVGSVTYATTSSSAGLNVSKDGVITTSGALAKGSYTVSGTDGDASGDTGAWTYTLTVNASLYVVTFNANGGSGTMAAESGSSPTALALNAFARSGYAFVQWNTAANGSGSNYADGSTFPFSASIALYAQWKVEKKGTKPAFHVVTFRANGGSGTMAPEREKSPRTLTFNRFTRYGSNFTGWNTAANGSGSDYLNGTIFPFSTSVTLYAQWTSRATYVVTFNANGGRGRMAAEGEKYPTALRPNAFKRAGYTFIRWNTAAKGSGSNYTNGAVFPFSASVTLYAQWKARKVVVIPAINAVARLGPFAVKSSALSAALDAQIVSLARQIKTNRDTRIALVGYGDTLSAANQLNESAWAANFTLSLQRASAVEAYLRVQLRTLGVKRYTIVATGHGTANPTASGQTTAEKAKDGRVIATIT